jgi:dihydrofolate synthase/folylpolyglutamate synthase
MNEFATNDRTGEILGRLQKLYPQLIDLSLGRVQRLLRQAAHPERFLPPVIHVAGTNGKGSTCAFLRAIGEAAFGPVHVTTSPHLVRLNERFRVASRLVSDTDLVSVLAELEHLNAGEPITLFEVLAVAGYVLFARTPASLCVVEVGLGGRYDATNVIDAPACAVITSISLDHQDFLGDTVAKIAWEKAGIIKAGRPAVTATQPNEVLHVLRDCATDVGARLLVRGQDWQITPETNGLRFEDPAGTLALPWPSLPGPHQIENAGLAVAAMRASGLQVPAQAYAAIAAATWPARLQTLHGDLARKLPPGFDLWLDGGHNPGAGQALAAQLRAWPDRPVYLVIGMKQSKDVAGFLAPLLRLAAGVWAVAEPGQHLALPVENIIAASGGVAQPGPDLAGAFAQIATHPPGRVLICGSLYLAGEALRMDGSLPA